MIVFIIVGLALLATGLFWLLKKGRSAQGADSQSQQQNIREANELLKQINASLGFPPGQGPTGIMVEGQYQVVNIGHTERMKNDPVYAFGNEIAGISMDLDDLESALKEAQASGNTPLARSISNEMLILERKAHELMDKHHRERFSG